MHEDVFFKCRLGFYRSRWQARMVSRGLSTAEEADSWGPQTPGQSLVVEYGNTMGKGGALDQRMVRGGLEFLFVRR